jgi:hypothetical protein
MLLAGCHTATVAKSGDPVLVFRQRHPVEARSYSQLYPVSLKSYRELAQLRSDRVGDIIAVAKQKYADVPGLNDYADGILKADTEMWQNVERYLADVGEALPDESSLYEFEWTDGKKIETGLLVLRSGEIAKRKVWTTRDLASSAEKK